MTPNRNIPSLTPQAFYPGTLRLTVICLRYAILRKVLFAPRKLPISKDKGLIP
jgi:hypothetical protein